MKFRYDINRIVRALDINDLLGLYRLIQEKDAPETWASQDLEEFLIKTVPHLPLEEKQKVERLMLDCARYNSIGF